MDDATTAQLNEHRAFVRRLARQLLRDDSAADDVSQDAWVALLQRPQWLVGDVRGFLAGTVRNLVRRRMRDRVRRREEALVEDVAVAAREPLDEIDRVVRAVRSLEEPLRTAIVLRYYRGLAPREIARRCQAPLNTVKARLKRGLAKLRASLAERTDGRDWRSALLPLAGFRSPAVVAMAGALFVSLGVFAVVGLLWARPAVPPAAIAGGAPVASTGSHRNDPASLRRELAAPGVPLPDLAAESVGPTYALRLHGLPVSARTVGFTARLSAADPDRMFPSAFGRVVFGPRPTVRFAPDAAELRGGPPWQLEVRSDDGGWYGRTTGIDPARRDVVGIDMVATGSVVGLVRGSDGKPVSQGRVEVRDGEVVFFTATDAFGRFELRWISPGSYGLRASSHLHAARDETVTVVAGTTLTRILQVEVAPGETVAGSLVDPPPGKVFLVLQERDGHRTFTREADAGGRFCFDRVPIAAYQLTVHTETLHRWSPSLVEVTPPQTGVRLTCRSAVPSRDVTVRARSVAGRALEDFDLFVRLDGQDDPATTKVLHARGGTVVLRGLPIGAGVEWIARARGHVPRRGTERDLAAGDLSSGDSSSVLEVTLRPGWGNRVRVEDRDGAPRRGVTVLLDGVAFGRTGATGELDVVAPTAPRTVSLGDGLELVGGDVDPADHRFLDLIWGVCLVADPIEAAPVSNQGR